jgi:carbon starvation protein CstA
LAHLAATVLFTVVAVLLMAHARLKLKLTVTLPVVFTSATTQLVMTADVFHNTVVAQLVQT